MNPPNAGGERALLEAMFRAAIAAAQPDLCIPPHLPQLLPSRRGRLIVIGAGKASAAMAQAPWIAKCVDPSSSNVEPVSACQAP